MECQGNQITFWFDGRLLMPPLQDNSLTGKVGFWTKSDAVSYFSDPVIDYTPQIPVAQTLVESIMEKQPRILGLQIYTLNNQGGPHIIASKDERKTASPALMPRKKPSPTAQYFMGGKKAWTRSYCRSATATATRWRRCA